MGAPQHSGVLRPEVSDAPSFPRSRPPTRKEAEGSGRRAEEIEGVVRGFEEDRTKSVCGGGDWGCNGSSPSVTDNGDRYWSRT